MHKKGTMQTRVNFSLKDTPNKDGKTLIFLFVSHPIFGRQLKLSTGLLIDPLFWDKATQRAIINKNTPKFYKNLNESLNDFVELVSDFERKSEIDGLQLSKDGLKSYLQKKLDRKPTENTAPKLFTFISQYIETKRNSPTVNAETIRQHNIAVTKLKEYSDQNKKGKLDFQDIENPSFTRDFHAFLYGKGLSTNTVAKTTKELMTIFNAAKEQEYLSEKSLKKFRVNGETADAISLTEKELSDLLAFDLSSKPRLEKVRDLFCFGCWTGLRFEDWTKIERQHITDVPTDTGEVVTVIKFLTSKTRTLVHIPLFEPTRRILEKYDYQLPINYDGTKPVSNQKTNTYLKEVFELMGWTENRNISESVAGKRQALSKPFYQLISTHTARRTFITNLIERGLNYETISKATGHKDFDSFKKYNKMAGDRAAVTMFNWVNENRRAAVPRVAPLSIAK